MIYNFICCRKLVTGLAFLNNEGSALYSVQSKANHSCFPNVQASFPTSNHVLHLVALKDIVAGNILFIAKNIVCKIEHFIL